MHKPPIGMAALRKAGAFDEDKFFQEMAEQAGYIDAEQAKKYYMALVRVMTKRLRQKGVIQLPYLGTFAVVWQKDKWGWAGKQMQRLPGVYAIKFYILESWKDYWAKFAQGSIAEGSLDPRKKVLNRDSV
jgi:nucleoid DNA-binding protein